MLGFRKTFGNLPRNWALQSRACGRIFLWPAVILMLFAHAGCPSQSPSPAAAPAEKTPVKAAPGVARTQIDRGLIKVTVEVQPNPARLSDEPTLTLTIDSARGVVVEKPPFGEAIGGFTIRDFREPLPETQGDREIRRQIYTLEPVQTGMPSTLTRSPWRSRTGVPRATGSGIRWKPNRWRSKSRRCYKPMCRPGSAEADGGTGRVAANDGWRAALAGRRLARRGPRRGRRLVAAAPAAQGSPGENVVAARTGLPGTGGVDSGKHQRHRCQTVLRAADGIVRRFIERTTGVHAPEQTTEEFLREIGRGQLFLGDERTRLKAFLESADLVKFAAQEPTAADVEQTFQRAQAFLGLQAQEAAA
jgi:hypothetical protein